MNKKLFSARKIHYTVAVCSFVFLTSSAVTGLLWAYAPYFYWAKGYKELKHEAVLVSLDKANIPVSEVLERTKSRFGEEILPVSIILRSDAGLLLYEIYYKDSHAKEHAALMDAVSGVWRSPLSREDAVRFAGQYVARHPDVEEALFLKNWISRQARQGRPAWHVRFHDDGRTEIFIDPETGKILEDQDRVRRFHFWVMRVHQFNFFGTHKILTILSGLPILLLVITGTRMVWSMFLRRAKHGS